MRFTLSVLPLSLFGCQGFTLDGGWTAPRVDTGAVTSQSQELPALDVSQVQWTALEATTNWWELHPDWTYASEPRLSDVRDGVVLSVEQTANPDERRTLLVSGSLLRPKLRLPEQATVVAPAGTVFREVTGDGVLDAILVTPDPTGGVNHDLVPGPLPVTLDGEASSIRLDLGVGSADAIEDLNLDGIADRVVYDSSRVAITWGPASRWDGAADVHLMYPCGLGLHDADGLPDLTGDGTPELRYATGCSTFLMPMPRAGTFAVGDGEGGAYDAVAPWSVIPDQNGDGWPDVQRENGASTEVLFAPLLFVNGRLEGATRPLRGHVMPFDLTGDRLADQWVYVSGQLDAVVVPSGPELNPIPSVGWELPAGLVLHGFALDEGRAISVVGQGGRIGVANLGPAEPVPWAPGR